MVMTGDFFEIHVAGPRLRRVLFPAQFSLLRPVIKNTLLKGTFIGDYTIRIRARKPFSKISEKKRIPATYHGATK